MVDQDAQDLSQMMSARQDVVLKKPKKNSFLWVILGCLVIGVAIGIVVYQQSTKVAQPVKTTPKPTPVAVVSPIPSAISGGVNLIQPLSKVVTFPRAGKIAIYFSGYSSDMQFGQSPELVRLTIAGANRDFTMPTTAPAGYKMFVTDTNLSVTAGTAVTVNAYDWGNVGSQAYGWIAPTDAGLCIGSTGTSDASQMFAWAVTHAGSEPIVAKMCWGDAGGNPKDDFNDFVMVLTYTLGTSTSTSPSPSPSSSAVASVSPSPSPSLSPSPSPSVSPSPSPSPSVSPSPSASSGTTVSSTPTPTSSARAAMPDTSGGTPVTGIFEVTVGTVSVGLVLLVLGLLGLLAL